MAKKNQRIFTILGAAFGTGLAVYGVRQGARWYRQQQMNQRYRRQLGDQAWISEGRASPMEEPIPMTGAGAPPMAPPRTNAERVNSDRVGDYDDRGTAFRASEMGDETGRLTGEANTSMGGNIHGDDAATRDESLGAVERGPRGNTELYGGSGRIDETRAGGAFGTVETDANSSLGVSPEDTGEAFTDTGRRPDTGTDVGAGTRTGMDMGGVDTGRQTQARPQSGVGGYPAQQTGLGEHASQPPRKIVMDEVVAPLIEHAIAFNSVMNLLRSRQRDGVGNEGIESLTEGDRNSMRAVLDQMQERVTDYDEADMRKNPLALRSYQLTQKLRDALDNLNYTGSDLYRIQSEVQKELCQLARELDNSGQVTITGLDQIRQLYECQGLR